MSIIHYNTNSQYFYTDFNRTGSASSATLCGSLGNLGSIDYISQTSVGSTNIIGSAVASQCVRGTESANSPAKPTIQEKINEVIEQFINGKISAHTATQTLKRLPGVGIKSSSIMSRSSTLRFTYNGTSYRIYNRQSDNNTSSAKIYAKTDLQNNGTINLSDSLINQYFNLIYEDSNGKTMYTIKPDSGYKTPQQLMSALFEQYKQDLILDNFLENKNKEGERAVDLQKLESGETLLATNFDKYAEEIGLATGEEAEKLRAEALDKLIKDYTSGNMNNGQIWDVLNAIGVETLERKIGRFITYSFTYDGKQYTLNCNMEAAKLANDDIVQATYTKDELLATPGADEILINNYFVAAASVDNKTTIYRLRNNKSFEEFQQDAIRSTKVDTVDNVNTFKAETLKAYGISDEQRDLYFKQIGVDTEGNVIYEKISSENSDEIFNNSESKKLLEQLNSISTAYTMLAGLGSEEVFIQRYRKYHNNISDADIIKKYEEMKNKYTQGVPEVLFQELYELYGQLQCLTITCSDEDYYDVREKFNNCAEVISNKLIYELGIVGSCNLNIYTLDPNSFSLIYEQINADNIINKPDLAMMCINIAIMYSTELGLDESEIKDLENSLESIRENKNIEDTAFLWQCESPEGVKEIYTEIVETIYDPDEKLINLTLENAERLFLTDTQKEFLQQVKECIANGEITDEVLNHPGIQEFFLCSVGESLTVNDIRESFFSETGERTEFLDSLLNKYSCKFSDEFLEKFIDSNLERLQETANEQGYYSTESIQCLFQTMETVFEMMDTNASLDKESALLLFETSTEIIDQSTKPYTVENSQEFIHALEIGIEYSLNNNIDINNVENKEDYKDLLKITIKVADILENYSDLTYEEVMNTSLFATIQNCFYNNKLEDFELLEQYFAKYGIDQNDPLGKLGEFIQNNRDSATEEQMLPLAYLKTMNECQAEISKIFSASSTIQDLYNDENKLNAFIDSLFTNLSESNDIASFENFSSIFLKSLGSSEYGISEMQVAAQLYNSFIKECSGAETDDEVTSFLESNINKSFRDLIIEKENQGNVNFSNRNNFTNLFSDVPLTAANVNKRGSNINFGFSCSDSFKRALNNEFMSVASIIDKANELVQCLPLGPGVKVGAALISGMSKIVAHACEAINRDENVKAEAIAENILKDMVDCAVDIVFACLGGSGVAKFFGVKDFIRQTISSWVHNNLKGHALNLASFIYSRLSSNCSIIKGTKETPSTETGDQTPNKTQVDGDTNTTTDTNAGNGSPTGGGGVTPTDNSTPEDHLPPARSVFEELEKWADGIIDLPPTHSGSGGGGWNITYTHDQYGNIVATMDVLEVKQPTYGGYTSSEWKEIFRKKFHPEGEADSRVDLMISMFNLAGKNTLDDNEMKTLMLGVLNGNIEIRKYTKDSTHANWSYDICFPQPMEEIGGYLQQSIANAYVNGNINWDDGFDSWVDYENQMDDLWEQEWKLNNLMAEATDAVTNSLPITFMDPERDNDGNITGYIETTFTFIFDK